jgi:hypothetical protein
LDSHINENISTITIKLGQEEKYVLGTEGESIQFTEILGTCMGELLKVILILSLNAINLKVE